ncbi:2',5'-phosphodiesterase 12 [Hylaeus volcanicus]|uniref:2',5'-phosphodiesterase 12 n=1 Tax=Hylaeus volcanicus TaxID=313075 RepID=UPI0023B81A06|nr:2',5'-phosphodiesterase 12 [Hylaeus volcanicus]
MSLLGCKLYSRCITSLLSPTRFNQHFFKKYSQPHHLLNMNEVLVRYDKGNQKFEVSLRYVNSDLNVDKQFNFNRNVNESINTFLTRISMNIKSYTTKKLNKRMKIKRKDTEVVDDIMSTLNNKTIKLIKDDSTLDGELPCKSILEDASNIKLVLFGTEYVLKQNVPFVTAINLPTSILIGFPTYPSKFQSVYVDKLKSTFNWYRKEKDKWIHVGEGYLYVPDASNIGHKLKITCVPRNDTQVGPIIEVVSLNPVEAGPGPCPFEDRHAFTRSKLSGKSFRVTSYNILANVYSETSLSKDVLYPYCPSYALSMDYRKLLILKELIGYNSDIICLQEVDKKIYENDLLPALCTLNYDSIYNLKNDLREGITIFYNRDRFDKLSSSYSVLSQDTDLIGFNDVWSKIQNERVKQTYSGRSTIIQTLVLQSKENSEILIVGNTHLYFRPDANHIRLLQAYYGLMYLQKFAKDVKEENPECNVSIIYCGDFNSVPENAVYQLMTENYVPEDCADWKSSPDEVIENVSLKHDLNLASACGTPKYTNYTGTFCGCLDYIFYQKDYLRIEQVIPIPSTDELSLHTGLPSVVFPSDHISLCVDLNWIK